VGDALLQVVDVELRPGVCAPLSFEITRGEIHGLLFPPDADRSPLLRVLTGVDRPAAGRVDMPSGPVRVAASPVGASLSALAVPAAGALATGYDLVLIEDPPSPTNDRQASDLWARFSAERERGAAIVIATSSVEQAYLGDRVSLTMWDHAHLLDACLQLGVTMHALVDEFLRLLEEGRSASSAAVAGRLKRLNQAARDLAAEGRKHARLLEQQRSLRSRNLASHRLDDVVLDAPIREQEASPPAEGGACRGEPPRRQDAKR
jgi:energy-coupling factor transporter ATP-binding protein EcfA2